MARSVSSLKRMGKMAFIFSACRAYVYVRSIVSEHKLDAYACIWASQFCIDIIMQAA